MGQPDRRNDIEAWFVRRGVPHFIESYSARHDIWTRALPVLVPAYLLGGLNALDLQGWSVARNLGGAVVVMALLVSTWLLTNALRRRPLLSRPHEIGPWELAAFVVGPAVPSLVFGQSHDAIESVAEGLGVLALIYFATSYGALPLLRWAVGRAVGQLSVLGNLVARALPLLLLFITFLFINAEVWQVAGTLTGPAYWVTIGVFFVLGATFVLTRVGALTRSLDEFTAWDDIRELTVGTPMEGCELPVEGSPPPPTLSRRQRFNVALLSVFNQALQVTSVALLVGLFFVGFGLLAISTATTAGWTTVPDVHVLATLHVGSRQLVVTEPLLRVAGFLAAFTGMYFTVVLATDDTYRSEFAEDVAPQVRQVLAVHRAYALRLQASEASR